MGRVKNYNYNSSNNIPKTLGDCIFYGLTLDEEQKNFRDTIWDPEKLIIFCNAKAGTGKTTISLGVANLLVQYGLYNGIVYIVSPTMEQKQGYLPGDLEMKSAPYTEPLLEALITLGIDINTAIKSENNMQSLKEGKAFIEFTVDTYLRGVNFENKVVILDESQNFYGSDMKKVLTRIHDSCKTIVIGHTEQCDLYKHKENSGFHQYLKAFQDNYSNDSRVGICNLSTNHRGWVSTTCDNIEIRG